MPDKSQIATLIRRVSQAIDRIATDEVGKLQMTYRQVVVLVEAWRNPNRSQREITDATGIDRTTVNIIIDKLTAKHLLKQTRNRDDKRILRISCTAEGQRRAEAGNQILTDFNAQLRDVLKADYAAVERGLESILSFSGEEKADVKDAGSERGGRVRTAKSTRVRVRA